MDLYVIYRRSYLQVEPEPILLYEGAMTFEDALIELTYWKTHMWFLPFEYWIAPAPNEGWEVSGRIFYVYEDAVAYSKTSYKVFPINKVSF